MKPKQQKQQEFSDVPYRDPNEKTKSAENGIKFARKIFIEAGESNPIEELKNIDFIYIFSKLKLRYKMSTLLVVYNLIAKWVNPVISEVYDLLELKKEAIPSHKILSSNDIIAISKVIKYYFTDKSPTGMAVAIAVSSNLRSSEIAQLTVKNLKEILDDAIVTIRIKKRLSAIRIEAIKSIVKTIMDQVQGNATNEKVIKCSVSVINENIKKKFIEFGGTAGTPVGIQLIRSFNTSILFKYLQPDEMAKFNRHQNINTSSNYYNLTYKSSEILDRIFGN